MPTPLLRLLLHATHDEEPHFAILDEMNLAKVEYYFSDFLSAMESGTEMVLHSAGDSVFAEIDGEDVNIPERLAVPSNVLFTGTVNVDETTYMFSPKVLDRANVIEFHDVDSGGLRGRGDEGRHLSHRRSDWPSSAARVDSCSPPRLSRAAGRRHVRCSLRSTRVLADYHLHFGYRVANEIGRYVRLARRTLGDERC